MMMFSVMGFQNVLLSRQTMSRACSSVTLFKSVVIDAAADAKKTLRLVKVLTQSPDHPILPAIPETEYLRGLLVQVM